MLDIIANLFMGLFGAIGSLLPDSPFAGYIQSLESMSTGLGWLNWLVPMSDFSAILVLWIIAGAAVAAIRFAVSETLEFGTALV